MAPHFHHFLKDASSEKHETKRYIRPRFVHKFVDILCFLILVLGTRLSPRASCCGRERRLIRRMRAATFVMVAQGQGWFVDVVVEALQACELGGLRSCASDPRYAQFGRKSGHRNGGQFLDTESVVCSSFPLFSGNGCPENGPHFRCHFFKTCAGSGTDLGSYFVHFLGRIQVAVAPPFWPIFGGRPTRNARNETLHDAGFRGVGELSNSLPFRVGLIFGTSTGQDYVDC